MVMQCTHGFRRNHDRVGGQRFERLLAQQQRLRQGTWGRGQRGGCSSGTALPSAAHSMLNSRRAPTRCSGLRLLGRWKQKLTSTAQHSALQHSTAQGSTLQPRTARRSNACLCSCWIEFRKERIEGGVGWDEEGDTALHRRHHILQSWQLQAPSVNRCKKVQQQAAGKQCSSRLNQL